MTYYTFQFKLNVEIAGKKIHEINNIEQGVMETMWPQIYMRGLKIRVGANTHEVVSPLHINTFFIIQQPEKL